MAKIQDVDIPHLEFAEAAAPGTPASGIVRLYAKSDGLLYSKDDAGNEEAVSGAGGAGGTLQADRDKDTASANSTEAAGTWTDTGLQVTLTTGAHRCLVTVVANAENSSNAGSVQVDVAIDGTREGGAAGLIAVAQHSTGAEGFNVSFSFVTDALSAASHTFKVQFRRTGAGTATFYMGASGAYPILSVVELAV